MGRKRSCAVFIIFILCISLSPVSADSSVWKIVNGSNQLYIGGTIHVLSNADYPLPPAFEKAYNQSTIVVFETDMKKMQTPKFQKMLLQKMTYSDGKNLKTVLDGDTFKELSLFMKDRGIPMDNMIHFKPSMVAVTLTVLEIQRLGLMGTGVDEFFHLRAMNDQKELGQLETVFEQLDFITNMGKGREDEFILHTLRDIEELSSMFQQLKDAWRTGDTQKINDLAITPIKKDFPKLYNDLMVERNNAWIPKIEAMLETEDVEFVLVGAAHLVGSDGVLEQLAAKGYDIQNP